MNDTRHDPAFADLEEKEGVYDDGETVDVYAPKQTPDGIEMEHVGQVNPLDDAPEDEDDEPGDPEDDYVVSDQPEELTRHEREERAKARAKIEHEDLIAEKTMEVGKLAREMSHHRAIANGLAVQIKGLNQEIDKLVNEGPDYRPLLEGNPFPNARPAPPAVLQKPAPAPIDDSWAKADVDVLGLSEKKTELLRCAGFTNLGLLEEARGNGRLKDTKGVGKALFSDIEARLLDHLAKTRDKHVFDEAAKATAERLEAAKQEETPSVLPFNVPAQV